MKTQNLLMTFVSLFILGSGALAQPFEMAYHGTYGPGPWYPLYATDFQHYSIEATNGGDYVLAGTVLNSTVGHTDIHILKIDNVGNVLWDNHIDFVGRDDAALDVMVDPNDDIIITGYVSNGGNFPEMYVAKFDPSGAMIADQIVQGFPTAASAGTNIIFSQTTGNYIVGGFHNDPPVSYPIVDGEAVMVELDFGSLTPMAYCNLSTTGGPEDHTSVNDIVELPGMGYFAIGTMQSSSGNGGVLAVMVDPGLNIMADHSFNDGSWSRQSGVSAFYNGGTDEIIMVSNHRATGFPQIRRIVGASGGGTITTRNDITLYDQFMNPVRGSVFQIMECPWNPADIVLAGRFKFGPGTSDNNVWLLSLRKSNFALTGGMLWNVTSANYESFAPTVMGPLFSTFVGAHPYIFTEEIITNRVDMAGLTIVSPTDIASPSYGIDVVTTNGMSSLGCYDPIRAILTPCGHIPDPIVWTPGGLPSNMPGLAVMNRRTGQDWNCHDPSLPRGPETGDGSGDIAHELASIDSENTIGLTVSPNPSTDAFQVQFNGNAVNGQIQVMNNMGQIVYQSGEINTGNFTELIDLSAFENGIYILQFSDGEHQITKKLIKL